jgi:hypothetical protein
METNNLKLIIIGIGIKGVDIITFTRKAGGHN